jgi:hypothetical protein
MVDRRTAIIGALSTALLADPTIAQTAAPAVTGAGPPALPQPGETIDL